MKAVIYICFYAFMGMLTIPGCHSPGVEKIPNESPSFIIILVDDLGKEWISSTGADSIQTPFIDKLAKMGVSFDNAYSMPQCTPSRVALLTGTYPYHNGWINHFDVPRWGHGARFDPERNQTFARVLREAGYKTCAAGKWQINDFRLEPDAMEEAGFDAFCMWTGGEGGNEKVSEHRYWDPYIHTKEGSRVYKGKFGPDIFTNFIIRFMQKNRDSPMLIYYPMVLTHTPFVHTPLEPTASTPMEKHKAMVRYTDHLVGRLVMAMEDLGIRENSYLIFTTDNGTAGSVIGSRNGILIRGGKTFLTENGVNAPFIVNAPGHVKSGTVSGALVDFTDVFPTLVHLAGIPIDEEIPLDGHSFAPALMSDVHTGRSSILAMGSHPGRIGDDGMIRNWYPFRDRVLRDKRYKVYVDTLKQIHRLYDLLKDPQEKENLIGESDMEEILGSFEKVVKELPDEDRHPDYKRLDSSYYNVPPEYLERSHKKLLGRSNMSAPVK
ncbi:MAG: N-acetylgalactosamine 6-sulfate sulfatase [Bacteroidetes bacterium]|nr:MAG: N-acetylgalactosamine 6-sulfate sulfatase [Bacteroidota bacterium]